MAGPLVIEIAISIFYLLTPILHLVTYIFCAPQFILKYFKLVVFDYIHIRNYIQLTCNFGFFLIYIAVHLNLHFMFFFKYYLGVDSILQLTFSFIIINTLTAIIYKVHDMKFYIWRDTPYLFFLTFYEIVYILIFICFFVRFGDVRLLDFLMFRQFFRFDNFFDLIFFSLLTIGDTFALILVHLLVVVHFINPISMVRGISLVSNEYNWSLLRTVLGSTFYIFQDFLLIIAYVFNIIFIKSFIVTNLQFISDLISRDYKRKASNNKLSSFEYTIDYAKLYLYVKHNLILNNFKKNIRFFIGIFFASFTLIFFWKFPKVLKDVKKLWAENDLKEFAFNCALNIVNGFMEIITPVILIYNHVIPFNYFSLSKLKNYYRNSSIRQELLKKEAKELNYSVLNLFIFIQKGFDYAVTLFTFTQIFNFNFWVYLMKTLRRGRLSFSTFFPLLSESECFVQHGQESHEQEKSPNEINTNLEIYTKFLQNRRKIKIEFTKNSNVCSFLILASFLSICDPFYGFKYFKNLYQFAFNVFNSDSIDMTDDNIDDSNSNNKLPLNRHFSFNNQQKMLKTKMISNLTSLLKDILFYIPVNLILALTAPWCLIELLIFIFKTTMKKPILKMKNYDANKMSEKYSKLIHNLSSRVKEENNGKFTKQLVDKWIEGWKFIIEVLLVHLFLVRGFLLWKQFIRLKKYKRYKAQQMNSGEKEKINSKSPIKKQVSMNTEKFLKENDFKLFNHVLEKNTKLLLKELIFYPFLILFAIITPWNIFSPKMKKIFKGQSIKEKCENFTDLVKTVISDVSTILIGITVFFSIVNTAKLIVLLYYGFRKNILRDEYSILLYNSYYKNDFKTEVKMLSTGIFKKLIILILIILNICLIWRILSVYRRLKRFLLANLAKDISRVKHFFTPKIEVDHHYFDKLSNTVVVSIFQFLPPGSIYNLMTTYNKSIYNKTQTNLVWQNLFENYYIKQLKSSATPEIYNLFENPSHIESYKQLCKDARSHLGRQSELSEEERDYLIGPLNVMIEETIESLLKIPHLILIPAKIISFFYTLIFRQILKLQDLFEESEFFQNYLRLTFIQIDPKNVRRTEDRLKRDNYYFIIDLQVLGVLGIFLTFVLAITNTLSITFSLYVILIKLIAGVSLRIPRDVRRMDPEEKVRLINNRFCVNYQYVITVVVILLHILFLLIPTFYFHGEGFANILFNNFPYVYSILNPISYLSFFDEVVNVFWGKGFFGWLRLFFGAYFLNIIFYGINYAIILILYHTFSQTNVLIYDYVSYAFAPEGLLADIFSNIPFIYNVVIFPHVYLIRKLNTFAFRHRLTYSAIFNIFYNIFILVLMILPFVFNFILTFSFFKFFMLNTYGITSLVKIVRVSERDNLRRERVLDLHE